MLKVFTKSSSSTNTAPEKRYKVGAVLGKGAFATVYSAIDRTTKKPCALKVVKTKGGSDQNPVEEFNLTAKLAHPNIVEAQACSQGSDEGTVLVQLELVNGGDLFGLLDPSGPGIDEAKARSILLDVVSALKHCHTNGITHADLKPENVLIHDGRAKLCDFGLAGRSGTVRTGSATGTGAYMAPELINRSADGPGYTLNPAHDAWALGILLYAILFADLPWEKARIGRDHEFGLYCRKGGVSTSLYPFNLLSSPMRGLMRRLLAVDPAARPSMSKVKQFLSLGHPFYAGDGKRPPIQFGLREIHRANAVMPAAPTAKPETDTSSEVSSEPSIHDEHGVLATANARIKNEIEKSRATARPAVKPRTIASETSLDMSAISSALTAV